MILHPTRSGFVAVPQSAHALLAFQLADHWGNRSVPRPSPRPDVLTAVLLHDAGWDGRELPIRLTPERQPLAFDTLPRGERETLWRDSVARASLSGRYVAYLVSHHVSYLAALHGSEPFATLQQHEQTRRQQLGLELASDPRYSQALKTGHDKINQAIVRLTDAISVHLCSGSSGVVQLGETPTRDGTASLELKSAGRQTWRLSPWPLTGRRLKVHVEGRALESRAFSDETALRAAWDRAKVVRLSWTLLAPGATPQSSTRR